MTQQTEEFHLNTGDILKAIGEDAELFAAHNNVPEFHNLLTHVTQATNGIKAVQVLCRGFLEMLDQAEGKADSPLASAEAKKPKPVNPNHP